jgi:hypothetical protein
MKTFLSALFFALPLMCYQTAMAGNPVADTTQQDVIREFSTDQTPCNAYLAQYSSAVGSGFNCTCPAGSALPECYPQWAGGYYDGTLQETICVDQYGYASLQQLSPTQLQVTVEETSPGGQVGHNCSQGYWYFGASIPALPANAGFTSFQLTATTISGGGCNVPYGGLVQALNSNIMFANCGAGGAQYPTGSFYYRANFSYPVCPSNFTYSPSNGMCSGTLP